MTESEIAAINLQSKLVKKYSENIDRESAYEMRNKKIAVVEQANAEAQQSANEENDNKKSVDINVAVTKSVVKVLISAAFIRGAFSILTKLLKK